MAFEQQVCSQVGALSAQLTALNLHLGIMHQIVQTVQLMELYVKADSE